MFFISSSNTSIFDSVKEEKLEIGKDSTFSLSYISKCLHKILQQLHFTQEVRKFRKKNPPKIHPIKILPKISSQKNPPRNFSQKILQKNSKKFQKQIQRNSKKFPPKIITNIELVFLWYSSFFYTSQSLHKRACSTCSQVIQRMGISYFPMRQTAEIFSIYFI